MDNYVPPVLEEHEHIEPPDENDVEAAIESLKNNKAPGSDDLPAELFKNGGPEPVSYTHLDVYKRQVVHLVILRKKSFKVLAPPFEDFPLFCK